MIFFFIKVFEKEGDDYDYSIFLKIKKYVEMMCKFFEKKFIVIEIKENIL